MAPWHAYGRRHVHGIGLETAKGHADIEGGYADQLSVLKTRIS